MTSLLVDRFNEKLKSLRLNKKEKIAIAISGGSDSTALCFLCNQAGLNAAGVIVDHGFRKGSAKEAKWVKKNIEDNIGIKCTILTNKKPIPNSNIENYLRDVRFDLLFEYSRKNNIKKIFTGHHLDDQIETFLMRLERGSGLDGLAGMQDKTYFHQANIDIIRPLLSFSKTELCEFLLAKNIKWVEDPSNNDTHLTRNNIRKALSDISDYNTFRKRIATVIDNLDRARDYINGQKLKAENEFIKWGYGYAVIKNQKFFDLHEEISLRIIRAILLRFNARNKDLRIEKLKKLLSSLMLPDYKSKTLHGVEIFKYKDQIYFINEFSNLAAMKAVKGKHIWNNNYIVKLPVSIKNGIISPLGDQKLASKLPKKLLRTLPALKIVTKNKHGEDIEMTLFIPHISNVVNEGRKRFDSNFIPQFNNVAEVSEKD